MPTDLAKIDWRAVSLVEYNTGDAAVAPAAVILAHAPDLEVVAEGAEKACGSRKLRSFGCDLGQGYLRRMPLLVEEITAPLASRSASAVPIL